MNFNELVKRESADIKRRWLELILETYPADARPFFQKQQNRFMNPVGVKLAQHMEALFQALLEDRPLENFTPLLEEFVKVRTVQDFLPSQAIGYILFLKLSIRESLSAELHDQQLFQQWLSWESRIDRILLCAFDCYMKSCERIFEIRANNLKRQTYLMTRKLGVSFPEFVEQDASDNIIPLDPPERGGEPL
ncbi:MAG: RsbRD N-terminal domain-containing protein [bacterium]